MKNYIIRLSFWVGLLLFSIYLLSFSGKLHVMDELAVFTAGHGLAQYGRADINPLIWTNHWTPHPPGIWGQDNNLYTKKAPGISLLATPFIWLGHTVPNLNAIHVGLLTNIIITALTASLLLIWLTELKLPPTIALLTSLGYGLCTIAWVYARMFWGLTILGSCFLIALWAIYRYANYDSSSPHNTFKIISIRFKSNLWWLIISSLALSFGLTLRFEAILAALFVGLYVAWHIWHYQRALGSGLIKLVTFALPLILTIGLLAWFNLYRYGSLSETGYTQEIHFYLPWIGGFGLLFSPGNGLFLFAPFMFILFFGIIPAWRQLSRPYFWLITIICLVYWVFYGSWFSWGGTWGWGPRFLLPILPLMMIFVAYALNWLLHYKMGQFVAGLLASLSLIINLLGVAVDFNEHFLRLGRNDNFVFNWSAYPPLGHWQILQDGLVDIIWLGYDENWLIHWSILLPGLIIVTLAIFGLSSEIRCLNKTGLKYQRLFTTRINKSKKYIADTSPPQQPIIPYMLFFPLVTISTLLLTYIILVNSAQLAIADEQSQADLPILETLTQQAHSNDVLLMPMPPFVDAKEITTLFMGTYHSTLPIYAWIESMPRAILPNERTQIWQAATAKTERIWLFERWLTQNDPISPTEAHLNQTGFLVTEQWVEQSGRLRLYTVDTTPPALSLPMQIPFQQEIMLIDATMIKTSLFPGDVLKVQLTWQALGNNYPENIIAFIHLLNTDGSQQLSQQDRLLLNQTKPPQSLLLPGDKTTIGYGLSLPTDTLPGSYPLVVGLYSATTGERLYRADDSPDNFLYLTNITIN